MKALLPVELIENKIYVLRETKVMMDRDLAKLYGVETKRLKQAVKRNLSRFPADFIFEMTAIELKNWRSQFVTSKADKQGLRYKPLMFTEQGVAMLSSVLTSKRAIAINIQIMRTFVSIRNMSQDDQHLRLRVEFMEKTYDEQFRIVFDALQRRNNKKKKGIFVEEEREPIGFKDNS
ncbi:TPA: DNA-binding protein [Candidatus Uhrbacteria bacterium]|nr:DNA-binding protein [Candidatus Uhrbacteria bacterium]